MKFIESTDIPKRTRQEFLYNKIGQTTTDAKEKTFAKFTEADVGKNKTQKKYYISVYNNVPYDPYGIDSHRESYLKTSLKTVSKQTFDYYILYLQTRNSLYMTRAQRSFING